MRLLVALLVAGAILASYAWTAALPPSVAAMPACVSSKVSPGPYPKAATDPLGRPIALRTAPERIVSLALSADEILIELVPPERIAALTIYVDDPSSSVASTFAPKTAARTAGEPESLLALRPDLVLTSAYTRPETLALLAGAGVPVIGTGSHATFDDVLRAITTIGEAVGEPARARELVVQTRARIDAVVARAGGRRRRVLIWDGGFTYGGGTLEDEMIRVAGGVNVAASLHGATSLTEEAVIALAPEVVIVPVEGASVQLRSPQLVGSDPIWSGVEAVRRGEVSGVPRAWMGSTTHHAVRALEAIATILGGSGA